MKSSEAIKKFYGAIREEMLRLYRVVVKCNGRIQYKLYVWEDGELTHLEAVQGDNAWLQPRDAEPRELFYVDTITVDPGFDLWDCCPDSPPEDEEERERMESELVDFICESYDENLDEHLDAIIEDAEAEERLFD